MRRVAVKNGFRVVDADRHIMEPDEIWERYLEPPFRGRVQILGPGQGRRLVDGQPVSDSLREPGEAEVRRFREYGKMFSGDPQYRAVFRDALDAGFDAASNLRYMDREGVDVGVLFPTIGLYIIWKSDLDPQLSAAICRAYNNWLADYCSAAPPASRASRSSLSRTPPSPSPSSAGPRPSWASSACSGAPIPSGAASSTTPTTCRSTRPLPSWGWPSASTRAPAPSSLRPATTATASSAATSPATRWSRCSPR